MFGQNIYIKMSNKSFFWKKILISKYVRYLKIFKPKIVIVTVWHDKNFKWIYIAPHCGVIVLYITYQRNRHIIHSILFHNINTKNSRVATGQSDVTAKNVEAFEWLFFIRFWPQYLVQLHQSVLQPSN